MENDQNKQNITLADYNNKIEEITGSREQITVDKEEYEKLKKDVEDLKAKNSNYSTTEQEIGTWIDGKKLYRKVIDFGALPNNSTKEVLHNVTNVDNIYINYGASFVKQNGTNYKFGVTHTNTSSMSAQWETYVDSTKIYIKTGSDRTGYSAYVTIEYTKNK